MVEIKEVEASESSSSKEIMTTKDKNL